MPSKQNKWSSKASRGRPAAFRAGSREFISTLPTMGAPSNGFSMKDEAKHTASHQSSLAWISGDAKLRQRPVTFVSAGVIEPLKEEKPPDGPSDTNTIEGSAEASLDPTSEVPEMKDAENPSKEFTDVTNVKTTIEAVEQEVFIATLPVVEQRAEGSDRLPQGGGCEANELFFFDLGEDQPMIDPSIPPPKIPSPRPSLGGSDSSEEVILFRGRTANIREPAQRNSICRSSVTAIPSEGPAECKPKASLRGPSKSDSQSTMPPSRSPRKQSRPQARHPRTLEAMKNEEEDAILADYIANMAANSDDDSTSGQIQPFSSHRDLGGDDHALNFGSGNEKSPEDDDLVGDGEELVESNISDAEHHDADQEMGADMDDELLARLLAKQEEFGMEGDDLRLFTSSFLQSETRKRRGKHSAKAGTNRVLLGSASAAQVADAFDNLDLADWGQLTGQSRKRRSKQPPNFNVSDSEMESALRTAWQRDRERKKSRKLERETLRAAGLLGKNADPDDLRVKYRSGMKLEDIKTELITFLLGSEERLDFPPLDKHARKVLHELANKFNVKSQSTGKGDQRRPVLYRTNRTIRYAATRVEDVTSHVHQAAMRIHRKYFHRVDVKVQGTEPPRNTGGGRSDHKALTLREGEIVGASVPELGQENKGRTMLEKMGWSKGMSLGASDNNGILEPVAQVMKRSKAGLG